MIDLHTHSTASDGTDNPEQLIKKANEKGIKALALTDHDTLGGLAEAEECAKDLSMDFIRGCELSTKSEDGSGNEHKLHILGLWIPKKCEELEVFLAQQRDIRNKRNKLMMSKFQDLGIKIDLEELQKKCGGSIGRPHIAQLLVEEGYVESTQEAFDKYLSDKGKAYVSKKSVSPEEAINVLAKQGAMVFIAHPLLGIDEDKKRNFIAWLEEKLPSWRSLGLCGMEAWHSVQNSEKRNFISQLAKKYSLEISGGSDYHGTIKPKVKLGEAFGEQPIPDSVYIRLKEYRKIKAYTE